jgi:hypothetical protein
VEQPAVTVATGQRALALLAGRARDLSDRIAAMQTLAAELPLTIQIEVNNLDEVNDLLRHKLHEEVLRRVIEPPKQRTLL